MSEVENLRWHVVFSSVEPVEIAEVARHLAGAEIDARVIQAGPDAIAHVDGGSAASADDDTDTDTDTDDVGSLLHILVAPEDAHEAAVEVGLYLAVTQSQESAGRIDVFDELGVEVDDLRIAELSATGGPTYDLADFDDLDQIRAWLDLLDGHGVRWTLSRDAQVLVHYNDEDKVDAIIERVFDMDAFDDESFASTDVFDADRSELLDPVVRDGSELPAASTTQPRRSAVYDVDGRPVVDDVTAGDPPIVTSGTPKWAIVVGLAVLVVVFIVFFV